MNRQPINKQHYVPETYINQFSYNDVGDVFTCKIKSPYPNAKVKSMNKSQICYKKHIYTLKKQETLEQLGTTDNFAIERELFDYENSFLEAIIKEFEGGNNINLNKSEKLIRMLISIKQRNVRLAEGLKNIKLANKLLENRIQDAEIAIRSCFKDLPEILIQKIISDVNKLGKEKLSDDDFRSDLANTTLKRYLDGAFPPVEQQVRELLNKKIVIFRTTEKLPFISSDNPGFALVKNDEIENIYNHHKEAFIFPLSKTVLIVFQRKNRESYLPIIKTIQYRKADEKMVNLANTAAVVNCNKLIFGSMEATIKALRDRFHSYYIDPKYKHD